MKKPEFISKDMRMIYLTYPILILIYFWKYLEAVVLINKCMDLYTLINMTDDEMNNYKDMLYNLLGYVFTLPLEVIYDYKKTGKLKI